MQLFSSTEILISLWFSHMNVLYIFENTCFFSFVFKFLNLFYFQWDAFGFLIPWKITLYWFQLHVLVSQLCLTLCDTMNYSPPGSSVHEILQVRLLEWVAISFSIGRSQPRDRTQVSCLAGRVFTIWATLSFYFVFKFILFSIRRFWTFIP